MRGGEECRQAEKREVVAPEEGQRRGRGKRTGDPFQQMVVGGTVGVCASANEASEK